MKWDEDSCFDLPIDALTDCRDLYELTTGAKGVPQDRTQRLLALSLRERRHSNRMRSLGWMNTTDMPSNGLTKYQPSDVALVRLLDTGKLIPDKDALINPSPAKRLLLSEFELASGIISEHTDGLADEEDSFFNLMQGPISWWR